jgi:hypothetical protein
MRSTNGAAPARTFSRAFLSISQPDRRSQNTALRRDLEVEPDHQRETPMFDRVIEREHAFAVLEPLGDPPDHPAGIPPCGDARCSTPKE